MIRFTNRRTRSGRWRSASIGFAALLVAAFGVFNVASASALGEQCSGKKARGLGAFLQTSAQERWTSASEFGFNGSPNPFACSGSQGSGGKPSASYVPIGSPAALHSWGADDGSLHVGEFGFPIQFLGTDIAPSGPVGEEGSMLANMKAALGSDIVVVPVTQTAISIVANPPVLPAHPVCTVPRINAVQLQKVFSGEIENWRKLNAASDPSPGGDCDQAITRIVRDEGAGTTYQFKHYLNSVNPSGLSCTGKSKRTWAQLQPPFGGETPPNVEWPRNADCQEGEGPVTTVAGPSSEGEQGPLSYAAEHPGTITYGSLPEAEKWAPKQIVEVHNGVKFADPANKEGGANCGAAKYTVPAGAKAGLNIDWSQVYGSNPTIGETAKNAYPICTLTWAVAAADSAGLFGNGVATTIRDYLAFVVDKEGGQLAVRNAGYDDLPNPVAKAAVAAIAQIGGEGEEEGEEEGGGPTVLCKVEPALVEGVLVCPAGQAFKGTIFGALTPETVATFKSTSGPEVTVNCTAGFFAGEFDEAGMGLFGGISGFHFAEEPCTSSFAEEPAVGVGFENPPYYASKFVYTKASGPQGFFQLAREDEAPPLLKIQRAEFGLECLYEPTSLNSQVTNGSPTEMLMTGNWKLLEGSPKGVCPTTLTGSAQISLTRTAEGLPIYLAGIEEGGEEEGGGGTGTVLCGAEPELIKGVFTCPKGEGFSGKVTGTLLPETIASFKSLGGPELNVTCPDAFYVGEFNEDGTSAGNGISSFEFGVKAGCATTFPEEPEAVVSLENPPYDASRFLYGGSSAPESIFQVMEASKGPVLLRIQSGPVCVYQGPYGGEVTNGSPTRVAMNGKWSLVEEAPEGSCPTTLLSSAQLTVSRTGEGLPLYIAGK